MAMIMKIVYNQHTGEKERTHTYIYDGFERLIEENVTFHTDVWLGDNLVRQAGEKVTRLMVNRDTLGLERLVIMQKSSNPVDMRNTKDNGFQNLWVHTDAQGSVVALTLPELTVTEEGLAQGDDFKDNVNAYVLGPFGVLDAAEVHTLHNEDAVYTGKLYDHEANLLYFHHRYYDPETKRFISEDPAPIDITDPRTINRFTFVNNNPLRFVDPDGRYGMAFPGISFDRDSLRVSAKGTGDLIQSVPQSVYSSSGLALSTYMLFSATPVGAPISVLTYSIGGLSLIKSYLDNDFSTEFGIDVFFEIGSNTPGYPGLTIEGIGTAKDLLSDFELTDSVLDKMKLLEFDFHSQADLIKK